MVNWQEERGKKLQQLSEGKLSSQQKADLNYKMAKILSRELGKLKEIVSMIKATPDSYLKKIDFIKAATDAMELTEILIEKAKPTRMIYDRGDENFYAEQNFSIGLGSSLPGPSNAIMELEVRYKPSKEEIRFNQAIEKHQSKITPPEIFHGGPIKEFINDILPAIKAKDPDLTITNKSIKYYRPTDDENKLTEEPMPLDPKLLDAIEKLAKEIGTGLPQKIIVAPYYSPSSVFFARHRKR
jgi:hypothetical protein